MWNINIIYLYCYRLRGGDPSWPLPLPQVRGCVRPWQRLRRTAMTRRIPSTSSSTNSSNSTSISSSSINNNNNNNRFATNGAGNNRHHNTQKDVWSIYFFGKYKTLRVQFASHFEWSYRILKVAGPISGRGLTNLYGASGVERILPCPGGGGGVTTRQLNLQPLIVCN